MKKYPKSYYATKRECRLQKYRSTTPKKARRAGILGWRKDEKPS